MSLYLVHMSSQVAITKAKIEEQISDYYKLHDNTYLVRSNNTARTVCEDIGLWGENGSDGPTGAVLQIHPMFYGGFEKKEVWDWLTEPRLTPPTDEISSDAKSDQGFLSRVLSKFHIK